MSRDPVPPNPEGGCRVDGLDVLVQGEGVRRDVTVEVEDGTIRVGDVRLPVRDVFWTSRRAGLLMLFGRKATLAVKGPRSALETVMGEVEAGRSGEGGRGRLPEELVEEVVVCTAGTAVVGRVGEHRARGLRVGVFTRRGVHLLAGDVDLRLGWPVDEARVAEGATGASRGQALELAKGDHRLRLLYLYPEEVEAIVRAARSEPGREPLEDGPHPVGPDREPAPAGPAQSAAEPRAATGPAPGDEVDGGASEEDGDDGPEPGEADGEIEMFDRREVAGPVRPRLPEFRSSVDVLREAAREAADRCSEEQVERAGLAPHFLETHFLELGETALGPFLLRKSAAATAGSLGRALEAMDASELQEDTEAAASNAADRLIEVYRDELDRLLTEKRAPARVEERHELDVAEREDVRLRLHAPFEKLTPLFRDLEEEQDELRREVRALETGPPDADDGAVRRCAEAWRRALRRVDRGFVDAWDDAVEEIAEVWQRRLLPSLAEVGARKRRRLPEWMFLVLLAVGTVVVAAGIVIFLLR